MLWLYSNSWLKHTTICSITSQHSIVSQTTARRKMLMCCQVWGAKVGSLLWWTEDHLFLHTINWGTCFRTDFGGFSSTFILLTTDCSLKFMISLYMTARLLPLFLHRVRMRWPGVYKVASTLAPPRYSLPDLPKQTWTFWWVKYFLEIYAWLKRMIYFCSIPPSNSMHLFGSFGLCLSQSLEESVTL